MPQDPTDVEGVPLIVSPEGHQTIDQRQGGSCFDSAAVP
jgi:hypothetical protein